MSDWNVHLFLKPGSTAPVYRQIAQALSSEVQRGRLRPGDPLPGYRAMAEQLGVSRNTVMAAFQDLQEQGWIVSRSGSGSEVAADLPATYAGGASEEAEPSRGGAMGFDLAAEARDSAPRLPEKPLRVARGAPYPRLIPAEVVARAYRRALAAAHRNPLSAADPQGHPRLRAALAAMLARTRGIAARPERVFVSRGRQNAFFLLAQALFAPGDAVAVERLGPRPVWETFERAGARCVDIPVDAEGMDVEALAAVAAGTRLRAVFVTPRRQYPTLVALSARRRARLLALAAERRFAVLEWDPDAELQFEPRPAASLAAEDAGGVVVHVGALSKICSPGLRLGFISGPARLVGHLKDLRAALDGQGDAVLEQAAADLMEEGELQGHLNRMNPVYRRRRDALCAGLTREIGSAIQVAAPAGGLALWAEVAPEIDVEAWAARALELGVVFRPGRQMDFHGAAVQGLRIGFASAEEDELVEVARRLRKALQGLAA